MQKIKELFALPVDRKIEEVIQVDQHDEEIVKQEIEEYVVTDSIKSHFITVYDNIAKYLNAPHRGIGIWISGFFGSGKSSFAKLLGYTLENRSLLGKKASERFQESNRDEKISNFLTNINSRFKIHSIIFDVSMDRGVRTASDRITEVMYKVLLRELNYPTDFDLAELEMSLEADGDLENFKKNYQKKYNKDWEKGKKIATNALNEASFILHEMKPDKYSTPNSWLLALGKGRADIDANRLAYLTFELISRRKPGYGIVYIIDEVGQYVARSTDKMLDLQAVVQALGKESENRIKAKKTTVPAWLIVTSQEKLNEVVDALDARRIELARLQDRFSIPIDLKQSDIREVTAKRVLQKNKDSEKLLGELYDKYEGRIKTYCSLERTHRSISFSKEDFIHLYPYLPYQVELSIDIVAGLRLRRGAQRHVGGSNRTIIKQAQQMLINPQTNLANRPIGALVTLDQIYELLFLGNLLPSEVVSEISAIPARLPNDPMALKVTKAIALLEVVRDLPRTAHNIAAVLHPALDAESTEKDVLAALKQLEAAQFVRESEQGYKLLTVAEKNWDSERQSKAPKERQKHDIIEGIFRDQIFVEPSFKAHRFKNLKTFNLQILLNDRKINDGTIILDFKYGDSFKDLTDLKENSKKLSRTDDHKNDIFWLFTLNEPLHTSLVEYYRSKTMVQEYSRIQSQGQITTEELACMEDEKHREQKLAQKIKADLINATESGVIIFQGIEKDASLLGNNFSDILKSSLNHFIPQIYTKLEMGACKLTGKEVDGLLKSANLNALPTIFYNAPEGLELVTKQGNKFLPNTNAPIVQEIFIYLKSQFDYGNKITGKILENHFENPPYGWDRDLLRLILALLFRAGLLEINFQGKKYKIYSEPASWPALINNVTFRSTTFSPRKTIGIPELTEAVKHYEEITGYEVDVDEVKIAAAFQKLAQNDLEILNTVKYHIDHYLLPGKERIDQIKEDIQTILNSSPDDCVTHLAGQGQTYKENHLFVDHLDKILKPDTLLLFTNTKSLLNNIWPILREHVPDTDLEEKELALENLLKTEQLYENIQSVKTDCKAIFDIFVNLFKKAHEDRNIKYDSALEKIKGHPEFVGLPEAEQDSIIQLFIKKCCEKLNINWSGQCETCHASLLQLESDILAVDALVGQALQKIHKFKEPGKEKYINISVRKYLNGEYHSKEDFETAIKQLSDEVLKYFLEGKKVFIE
ncbi:BREX system P-loop protein BrxC [candidate division KSB1 bacterium]|nr:BREX system P-loop protein BrxC [candidate division KSB1 bacterium]